MNNRTDKKQIRVDFGFTEIECAHFLEVASTIFVFFIKNPFIAISFTFYLMKNTIYWILALGLMMGFAGCEDKETKQRELDLKEKELELREKELNSGKEEGKEGAATSATVATATIKGKSVIMRQTNSVESAKLGNFDENEKVSILSEARPQNQNQAIAARPIKLYDDYNGKYIATLNKGKALVIESFEGNNYKVSYQHPEFGKLFAAVDAAELESISNEIWYKVKRSNGQEGWVLGKFVQK